MNQRLYKLRKKRFLHELIIDQVRGQQRGYCRCGKFSPVTEDPQEIQTWYKNHLAKSGIREEKKRVMHEEE